MKIGTIGQGKLGLPLSCCLAKGSNDVVGVDVNKENVDKINNKISPIDETGLQEFLEQHPVRATTDYEELRDSSVIFTLVPTPSMENGRFSNQHIHSVIDELVKRKIYPPVFNVVSTVIPGSCREFQQRFGSRTIVTYNPEFIALGDVINGILNPDFVLIGSDSKYAGDIIERIYRNITTSPVKRTNLVNAEISKMALNSYVTMKINFANTLGELCEKIEGGNVDDVTRIIGSDKRIGNHYLKSGMAYGGPCFPRDNRALTTLLSEYEVDPDVLDSVDDNNIWQTQRTVNRIKGILGIRENGTLKGKTITILGKAYKPNTPVIEESPSIILESELLKQGAEVKMYDDYKNNNYDLALLGSDLAVIALPSERLKNISNDSFINYMNVPRVLDCWRYRADLGDCPKIKYYALGVNKNG